MKIELYDLKYFKNDLSFSYSDMSNDRRIVKINVNMITSINNLQEFRMPLSGIMKPDKFSVVNVANCFYAIDERSYNSLMEYLNK